ncbi:MAG TPA: ABC transporter permease [Candidatus Babeliales bacterium]|jgi:ABC-2 type transport system permease protein|nr:ABC transporter permease [Candidatus Babeliales bacterium]
MISARSVWALVLRYLRLLMRDTNLKLATIYWPMLDIIVWGFLGTWLQKAHTDGVVPYTAIVLLGILLWQITSRGATYIFKCFAEELWSRNIVNLFSLPISLIEWMLAAIIYTSIVVMLVFLFCTMVIKLFYDISVMYIFSALLLFGPPLFFSACWLGFSCLHIIAYCGKRTEEIGWVYAWFFAPFGGAYYPIEVLPTWAQTISHCLPMSYVFEGMRAYLIRAQDPWPYITKAYILSIIYALVAMCLFIIIFNKSKQKGLSRLLN